MKKSHTGRNVGIGIIALVLIVVAFSYSGVDLKDIADTSGTSGIMTEKQAKAKGIYQVYGENFNLQTNTQDSLDVTITYGDDAELDTICWDARGSTDVNTWSKMPGGALSEAEVGDANIDLDAGRLDADGNVLDTGDIEMWCEFNLELAQDYFVDQAEIIRVNDNIDRCIWADANDDTDETWICRFDLSDVTRGVSDPRNEPFETIQIYLFDEVADATQIDTATASVLNIAQSDVTTELLVNIDISGSSADAIVISDIRLRNNLTSSTDNIYGSNTKLCFDDSTAKAVWFDTRKPVGCLEFSDKSLFDFDQQSSTQEWLWSVDSYNEGILITVPKNEGLQVDTPLKVNTKFTQSTDSICFALAYKYIDAFENKGAYDEVDIEATADSTNSAECTIT